MKEITMKDRIQELCKVHGTLRKVAEITGVDFGYLCKLKKEIKTNPSKTTCNKLGLVKVIKISYLKPSNDNL